MIEGIAAVIGSAVLFLGLTLATIGLAGSMPGSANYAMRTSR